MLSALLAAIVGALALLVGESVDLPVGVVIAAAVTICVGVVVVGVDAYVASRATHIPWFRSVGRWFREAGALLRDLLF